MATRRSQGDGSIHFDHRGSECRDGRYHRSCAGRWVGVISLGQVDGKRKRQKVSAQTKEAVKALLKERQSELDDGIRTSATYTVRRCCEDWLKGGLDGRSDKTANDANDALKPVLALIGDKLLRDLTVADVRGALVTIASTGGRKGDGRSTRTVQIARNCLARAIRFAERNDLVRRNVAQLAELPQGALSGRPSKALTLDQAKALMAAAAAEESSLHAYVVLSLYTGMRPEEVRALEWQHLDLDGAVPAVQVWKSVRQHGDTKTERSRRTLALPAPAAEALRLRRIQQEKDRANAGRMWSQSDLVFTTTVGTPLDAHNVRRAFRKICQAAGLGSGWSPRELRHSFVSLMSQNGVPLEEIARLAGHSTTRTTEVVYRKELRPVITTGAEAMARIFA